MLHATYCFTDRLRLWLFLCVFNELEEYMIVLYYRLMVWLHHLDWTPPEKVPSPPSSLPARPLLPDVTQVARACSLAPDLHLTDLPLFRERWEEASILYPCERDPAPLPEADSNCSPPAYSNPTVSHLVLPMGHVPHARGITNLGRQHLQGNSHYDFVLDERAYRVRIYVDDHVLTGIPLMATSLLELHDVDDLDPPTQLGRWVLSGPYMRSAAALLMSDGKAHFLWTAATSLPPLRKM